MTSTEDSLYNGSLCSGEQEKIEALQELAKLKDMVEEAEKEKSKLLLEKLDAEEKKKKFQKETLDLLSLQEKKAKEFQKRNMEIEESIADLERSNNMLKEQLKEYEEMLTSKKAEYASLQQKFKIKASVPEKKVKFVRVKEETEEEDYGTIECKFTITCRPSLPLKAGHALITFEEEAVAEKILMLPKCSVPCEGTKMDVKPLRVFLEPSVKFEVHISVSKKKIRFSNAPPVLAEERMRDRLELSFSKPSCDGGEVEQLEYDPQTGTGQVTFLNTGVAEGLSLKKKYPIDVGKSLSVNLHPYFEYQLKQFQTFSGVSKRTVLLSGIKDVLDQEDLQDHLEIYFQKPSNYGGEVETIKAVRRAHVSGPRDPAGRGDGDPGGEPDPGGVRRPRSPALLQDGRQALHSLPKGQELRWGCAGRPVPHQRHGRRLRHVRQRRRC
uniref:NID domain-containing protein n=1 Tax=Scleropages formosus TaxID=113540 RepID=A0A8C9S8A8_SCLFO